MSLIYFIRHAQAGARDNYDILSDLGQKQARLLGKFLATEDIRFSAVYSGSMRRQRLTAEIACSALSWSGLPVSDVETDERWNEFSLASVYAWAGPKMLKSSPEFASDFKEMQEALRLDPHTTRGATGRCDRAVMRAWITDQFPGFDGESWQAFSTRIRSCSAGLYGRNHKEAVAVFTSATPIVFLAGASLGLSEEKLLSLAGVLYNSSITIMRAHDGDFRLFSFNGASYLPVGLRTFR